MKIQRILVLFGLVVLGLLLALTALHRLAAAESDRYAAGDSTRPERLGRRLSRTRLVFRCSDRLGGRFAFPHWETLYENQFPDVPEPAVVHADFFVRQMEVVVPF